MIPAMDEETNITINELMSHMSEEGKRELDAAMTRLLLVKEQAKNASLEEQLKILLEEIDD